MLKIRLQYIALAAIAAVTGLPAANADADTVPSAANTHTGTTVYTASNSAKGNSVIVVNQAADGTLTIEDEYLTGGTGTGGGLGNQGAIAIDDDYLFVIDAGSDEVSSFRIVDKGLIFADRVASGGIRPVSVTVDRGVLYVVNAGSDNIAGFEVSASGELTPVSGSARPLSGAGVGAAQIGFSKDGRVLIVTEKATNRVVSFAVDRHGLVGPAQVHASPGQTPFGFAVTNGRRILVSEAAGGMPGLSSVSSWKVAPSGALEVIDAAEPTLQTAACWVAVTPNGRFAFTTNTGSNSLTAFHVRGGDLTLVHADGMAASTGAGSAPIDMAISPDGRFLHTLNAGNDTITTFRISVEGSLKPVATTGGLPDGATGLVAR